MNKFFKVSINVVLIIFSFIFLSGLFIYLNLFMHVSSENKWKEIEIPRGSSYSEGIGILREEGLIKYESVFLLLGRLTMVDRKLRAGYYNLSTSMTPLEVFNRIKKGMIVQYEIVIPEGSRLADITAKLKERGLIDEDSQRLVKDEVFLASLDIDAPSLEGYLYPDTYYFAKGADPKDIFRIMVQRLRENFDESLGDRAEELGMIEREVLTLASIIEHEALYDSERATISAVYHNRLKNKMRLQADPTVTYGTERRGLRIRKKDLRRATPYNTYVIDGLPPGPIASPGIKSIKAALYPADVDYMYFVSKNDGTHYFSRTGQEHMKAVTLYQRGNQISKIQSKSIPANQLDIQGIGSSKESEATSKKQKTN